MSESPEGQQTEWTAAELMATDPNDLPGESPQQFIARLIDLVASGECNPQCLFALDGVKCGCRCEGLWHGEMFNLGEESR